MASLDGELLWRTTQVEGLAADVQHDQRAWAVPDLDPLTFVDAKNVLPRAGGAR